jgi:hypothetical protein
LSKIVHSYRISIVILSLLYQKIELNNTWVLHNSFEYIWVFDFCWLLAFVFFFFGLCLFVFSFVLYFWWMGSHPWFFYLQGFFFFTGHSNPFFKDM